jgi:hypothetical protein
MPKLVLIISALTFFIKIIKNHHLYRFLEAIPALRRIFLYRTFFRILKQVQYKKDAAAIRAKNLYNVIKYKHKKTLFAEGLI